jgi:hypothetical protein
MIELALLCDRMDTDKSGALSLEEMLHGCSAMGMGMCCMGLEGPEGPGSAGIWGLWMRSPEKKQ